MPESRGKSIRYFLGILLLFIALNAFAGRYYGIARTEGVPVEWLEGSPFHNFYIPSLILMICVGGSALFAAIVVFKQSEIAHKVAFFCGLFILVWLAVQVSIIRYVSWIQPVTATVAILIFLLTWQLPKKNKKINGHEYNNI